MIPDSTLRMLGSYAAADFTLSAAKSIVHFASDPHSISDICRGALSHHGAISACTATLSYGSYALSVAVGAGATIILIDGVARAIQDYRGETRPPSLLD